MTPEWVTLGGGAVGSLLAAKWLWRGAAIASLLKVVALVLGALAVGSIVGVVDVSVNVARVLDLGRVGADLVGGLL